MDDFRYPRQLVILRNFRQVVQLLRDADTDERDKFDEWLEEIRQKEAGVRERN